MWLLDVNLPDGLARAPARPWDPSRYDVATRLATAACLLGCGLALLFGAGPASAQVEVLTPGLATKLDPAKERPLRLDPSGDAARLVAGGARWEEAGPPQILDLDRDGAQDFVVFLMADPRSGEQALVIHEWGDAPDVFGKAVFYVVFDRGDDVVEWGGTHRLTARPRAGR